MIFGRNRKKLAEALFEAIFDDRREYQAVVIGVEDLGSCLRLSWKAADRISPRGVELNKDEICDYSTAVGAVGKPVHVNLDDQNRVVSLKIAGVQVLKPGH